MNTPRPLRLPLLTALTLLLCAGLSACCGGGLFGAVDDEAGGCTAGLDDGGVEFYCPDANSYRVELPDGGVDCAYLPAP